MVSLKDLIYDRVEIKQSLQKDVIKLYIQTSGNCINLFNNLHAKKFIEPDVMTLKTNEIKQLKDYLLIEKSENLKSLILKKIDDLEQMFKNKERSD